VQQDLEEGQGVEAGKKYVEQGINLNASNMCWQEKTWTCLGVHSKIIQALWCLSANFLTALSDG